MEKKSSSFEPDFCPVKLDSDPWIVQPTEHYEELSIDKIEEKLNRAKINQPCRETQTNGGAEAAAQAAYSYGCRDGCPRCSGWVIRPL